jgi:hypothetical protein
MTSLVIIVALSFVALAAIVLLVILWRKGRRQAERLGELNRELVAVSGDASVGRRLSRAVGVRGLRRRRRQSGDRRR